MKRFLSAALVVFTSVICQASPVTGTYVACHDLAGHSGVAYRVTLKANEQTLVNVWADHGGQLKCALYLGPEDVGGATGSNSCKLRFVPTVRGEYTLIVVNQGDTADTVHAIVQ